MFILGYQEGLEIIFLQFGGLGSISWKKGGFSPFQWPTKIDIPSIVNDLSPALHPRASMVLSSPLSCGHRLFLSTECRPQEGGLASRLARRVDLVLS